ncbi:MAG: NUDIX domain-containing protein [Candidatus Dormibacteria bacterium]
MRADVSHLREEPLRRRSVFAGRLLHVFEDTVRLPRGQEASREVVEHPGAVTVVASDGDDRVILVRQWRHATAGALWELPAGTREKDEDPAATARRELIEETGYGATEWQELGHGPVSPGYSSEVIWFFSARGLSAGSSAPDPDELFDVELFDAAQLAAMARRGEVDLKTLAGLALAGVALHPAHG